KAVAYIILILIGGLAVLTGTSIGTVSVPFLDIIKIIISKIIPGVSIDSIDSMYVNIVWNIRLPRVLLAGFVGASLSIAGAAFQGLLRNPLADPYTLGISSVASVGAVVTIFFLLSCPFILSFTLPLLRIDASFKTIYVVIYFAKRIDRSKRVETIL